MRVNTPLLLEAVYASWAARDLDATLSCFADDVLFAMHLPTDIVPFAGVSRGKAELARRLKLILDELEFLRYKTVQITAEAESFRSQVEFHCQHKATGLQYEGRIRHVCHIEGGKIVHLEEFHDTERTRAFFELLAVYRRTD